MATSGFLLARARLHARLDEGASRRLTTVVAGPGFGKSTLLADWAADRPCAWMTVHPAGSSLPAFASGLIAAFEPLLPGRAGHLGPITGAHEPEPDERSAVEAVAAHLGDALRARLNEDLIVVIDDAQELPAAGAAARFVEGLCRHQTTVALSSSANPSVPGQPVTFRAVVTTSGPGTPTGTVRFETGVGDAATTPRHRQPDRGVSPCSCQGVITQPGQPGGRLRAPPAPSG